jgi:uncharacterized protein YeaO (DUF488 family)
VLETGGLTSSAHAGALPVLQPLQRACQRRTDESSEDPDAAPVSACPTVRGKVSGHIARVLLRAPGLTVTISIVRLGSKRGKGEGLRIGTVRRPPRGVPKNEFAKRDYYDVWLPELSPSEGLVKKALHANTDREWSAFAKAYRKEMKRPEIARVLDVLAALSHSSAFSVGCYCEDERKCHRSILRALLEERGARVR